MANLNASWIRKVKLTISQVALIKLAFLLSKSPILKTYARLFEGDWRTCNFKLKQRRLNKRKYYLFELENAVKTAFVSMGSKGGAVVRALASHQCGPVSTLRVDAICGLSLLLVLFLAPRGFSPGTPVLPSPQKPTFPNSNSTRNQVDEEPLCGCATCKSLFIYLFLFIFRKRFSANLHCLN